jgi:hypothetical protein
MAFELVETEFVRENSDWYLRVYIDKPGGINIDDCERLSREFSDLLDREDFILQAYILEVSSPGLDRPLKTEADFRRYAGELLEVLLLPGARGARNAQGGEQDGAGGKRSGGKGGGKGGKRSADKSGGANAGGAVVGTLVKFEGGLIYLTDESGTVFSLPWAEVKTAKRAIRF